MTPINLNKLRAEGFTIGLQPAFKRDTSRCGRPTRTGCPKLMSAVSQFLAQHTLEELCKRNQVDYQHARVIINRIKRRAKAGVKP